MFFFPWENFSMICLTLRNFSDFIKKKARARGDWIKWNFSRLDWSMHLLMEKLTFDFQNWKCQFQTMHIRNSKEFKEETRSNWALKLEKLKNEAISISPEGISGSILLQLDVCLSFSSQEEHFKKEDFEMGAVKTSSIEITKCHSRENKSWKFCETHLHSKNFYSILVHVNLPSSSLCSPESGKFRKLTRMKKFCSTVLLLLKGFFNKFAPDFLSGF